MSHICSVWADRAAPFTRTLTSRTNTALTHLRAPRALSRTRLTQLLSGLQDEGYSQIMRLSAGTAVPWVVLQGQNLDACLVCPPAASHSLIRPLCLFFFYPLSSAHVQLRPPAAAQLCTRTLYTATDSQPAGQSEAALLPAKPPPSPLPLPRLSRAVVKHKDRLWRGSARDEDDVTRGASVK